MKVHNRHFLFHIRRIFNFSVIHRSGFLATVFANFDVSPELASLGTDHSSPGSSQQTATDPHYADVVADEASRT